MAKEVIEVEAVAYSGKQAFGLVHAPACFPDIQCGRLIPFKITRDRAVYFRRDETLNASSWGYGPVRHEDGYQEVLGRLHADFPVDLDEV